MYEVEFTEEFSQWWDSLREAEQDSVRDAVELLRRFGVKLRYPHTSGVAGSSFSHMRELRVQHQGRPYRVLYAFDPRRTALLLIGGDKTGDNRWYDEYVPIAGALYRQHLKELREEKESGEKFP